MAVDVAEHLASLVGSVRRIGFSWKHYRHEAKTAGMPEAPLTLQFGFDPCKLTVAAHLSRREYAVQYF